MWQKIGKGVTMSEEEKMKIAVDLDKQGIDLFDLVEKNKRILDKYDKKE